MSIQAVSSQITQTNQTTSVSIPRITSTDSTVLGQQEKSIKGQISQLQGKSGSAQQVQQLNQVLQDIQKILQKQANSAQSQTSGNSGSFAAGAFANALDVRA